MLQFKLFFPALLLLLLLFSSRLAAQQYLSLGAKKYGIALGNAPAYNGLRLNLWDRKTNYLNGINIAAKTTHHRKNGINVAALISADSIANGIQIAGAVTSGNRLNGLSVGGAGVSGLQINGVAIGSILISAEKMNGIGISCIAISDTMNGAFFHLHGIFSKKDKGHLRGFSYATFVTRLQSLHGMNISLHSDIEEQRGLTIGVHNRTRKLRGVQIGLWNVALDKRILKRMPFINFNFRKKNNAV